MASKLGNPNNIDLLCVGMWYHCRSERGKCTSMFYSIPALKAHFKEKHPGEQLKLPDNLSQDELDGKITLEEKPKLRVYIVRCRLCFLTFESQSHLNFHRKKHPKCYLERGQGHRRSGKLRNSTYSTGRPPKPNEVGANVTQGTSVFQGKPEVQRKRSCTSTGVEVEPTKLAQKTGKKTVKRSSTKTTAPNVIATAGTTTSKKHGCSQPSKLPTKRGNAAAVHKNPRKLQDGLKVLKSSRAFPNPRHPLRKIRKLGVGKESSSKSVSKAIGPTPATYLRRFCCVTCQKSFSSREHLKRHLAIHSGNPSFQCAICKRRYCRKDVLAAHCKKVHQGKKTVAVNGPVGRKYIKTDGNDKQKKSSQVTPTAKNIIFDNTDLAESAKVVAAQRKKVRHTCPHCPFRSNDPQRLVRHLRLHGEGSNAVKCLYCGWFVGPTSLACHNNRRHPKHRESSDGDEPEGSGKKSGATNHVAIAAKIIKGGKRAATLAKTQKKAIPKHKNPIIKRENCRKKESTSGNEKRGRGRPKREAPKLPFSCPHCPFRCVPKTLAEAYRRLHEEGADFVACPICGMFLQPRTQALASHNGRCHPKRGASSKKAEPVVGRKTMKQKRPIAFLEEKVERRAECSGKKSGVRYACHLCPFKGIKGTWTENHRRLHEQGVAAVICPVCGWHVRPTALAVHRARRHDTAWDSSTARGE